MPAVCYVCSLSTTTKLFFLFIIHEHTMCIIDPGIPSTQNFFFFFWSILPPGSTLWLFFGLSELAAPSLLSLGKITVDIGENYKLTMSG